MRGLERCLQAKQRWKLLLSVVKLVGDARRGIAAAIPTTDALIHFDGASSESIFALC